MTRYFRLFAMQFRTSTLLAAQYRNDFFLDAFTGLFWTAAAVMPLFVVYGESNRQGIPGWSFGETLVVVACFISLQAVLDGMISPGLQQVIEHIRKGTLDFVLLKPADAQFLVSTSRFQFWKGAGLIHAGLVFYLAFRQLGHGPTLLGVALCILLLFVGSLLLYSLWVLIISAAFYFVKVDNLSYLFTSIFDAARWPRSVFKGFLAVVFTFIIPITVMTSFPAEALLGRLEWIPLGLALVGTAAFTFIARLVWLKSVSQYTSAGG